jgi:hypothetical protein
MWKLKEQGRDANSRGWRRYFYRGIRNHARSQLILIGAPTQREAHARDKHLVECRCFGSDRTPGVAPQGVFRSRTMLPTVARWFMQGARETVNNDVQVQAA